ncbi:MAG: LacI family transcriptional regulator [Thermoanaerobaculum sp.]|nr:LacI family transcriptional regulator [Thermoanaerobaculum sp.]
MKTFSATSRGESGDEAPSPPGSHVSIKDVARHAGVSPATVSRVLNGTGPVRPVVQERVWAAVKALGYVPHSGARSLARRKTDTVALVLPELSGDFYSQLLRGMELAARQFSIQLLVSSFHGDPAEVKRALAATKGRVDGIVLMWPEMEKDGILQSVPPGFPVVLLGGTEHLHHPQVTLDNSGGARAAVEHLIQLGHKVLVHLTGPTHNWDAVERRQAFFAVLGQYPDVQGLEIPGDFTEESGYLAATTLLELRPRPTAVFAGNDASAIGLVLGLRARGIQVPRQVSVVGFDDVPLARFLTPPLTTVGADVQELGKVAITALMRLRDGSPLPRATVLPTHLVVRGSTAPPPVPGEGGAYGS